MNNTRRGQNRNLRFFSLKLAGITTVILLLTACYDETQTKNIPFSALTVEKKIIDGESNNPLTVYASYKRNDERAAGKDGVYITSDDDVTYYYSIEENSQKINLKEIESERTDLTIVYLPFQKGIGLDQKWFTSDDAIDSYRLKVHESGTGVIYDILYENYGADATWFTDDDVIDSYTKKEVQRLEERTKTYLVSYHSSGNDNQWLTEDDVVGDSFLDKGLILVQPMLTIGTLSDSDFLASHKLTVDYKDGRKQVTDFLGSGSDGVVFTADDIIVAKLDRNAPVTLNDDEYKEKYLMTSYDLNGLVEDLTQRSVVFRNTKSKLKREVFYHSSGNDKVWDTLDDESDGYFEEKTVTQKTGSVLQTKKTSIAYSTIAKKGTAMDGVAYYYFTQDVVSSEDREVTTLRYFINDTDVKQSFDEAQFESFGEATHIKLN